MRNPVGPGLSVILCLLALSAYAEKIEWPQGAPKAKHQLLIVVDGLRPDYVQADLMPHLHGVSERGVWFEQHHAIYPTVTRVNAASISTGAYPEAHGLMDNSVYLPDISEQFTLSTSEHLTLKRIAEAEGELLHATSMGELLEEAGRQILVCSSGSSGSAFLLNHKLKGRGLINVDLQYPPALKAQVLSELGPVPEEASPNIARNRWIVDAYLAYGLRDLQADLGIIWITDPDHTAHLQGIGAPKSNEAVRSVDAEIGRIFAAIADANLQDQVNVLITSDHGFSTLDSTVMPLKILYQYMGAAERPMSDVVLAGHGVYFKRDAELLTAGLVKALQETAWVGSIYAPPSPDDATVGAYPGTLSMSAIRYNHPRAPHLLVSPHWSSAENEYGYPGTAALPGIAGHGSDSPYDIHTTLIAFGPDIAEGQRVSTPSANVDLAPTLCALLQVERAESMQGRILSEAFREPLPVEEPQAEQISSTAPLETGGQYTVTGHWTVLGEHRYYNFGEVDRTAPENEAATP